MHATVYLQNLMVDFATTYLLIVLIIASPGGVVIIIVEDSEVVTGTFIEVIVGCIV